MPEFPEEQWRELLEGSYRIIYRLSSEETVVRILSIVHGRRVLRRSLLV